MKSIRPNKVKRAVKGILGAVRKKSMLERYVDLQCDYTVLRFENQRIKGVNNDLVAYIANLERSQGVFSDTVWNPETQSWRKVA